MAQKAASKTSLADKAADLLRDRILDMTYEPGSRLNETELMRALSVGRTPIREALNRIAAEGLIAFEINKGPIVRPLDLSEINQIFEAYRIAGQISAAYCRFDDETLLTDVVRMQECHRAAIEKRHALEVSFWNYAFHTRIAESSNNDHIVTFCRRVNNHARRLNTFVYHLEATQPEYPVAQLDIAKRMHSAIVTALRQMDRAALADELEKQAQTFRKRVAKALESYPSKNFDFFANRLHNDHVPLEGSAANELLANS